MRFIPCVFMVCLFLAPAAGAASDMAVLVIEANSYAVQEALQELDLRGDIRVRSFTRQDIKQNKDAQRFIQDADVILVDVMQPELYEFILEHLDVQNTAVYALRGSREDERLRDQGFIFDPDIRAYGQHLSRPNMRNMLLHLVHKEIDASVDYGAVREFPDQGIYHPDAEQIFKNFDQYISWYTRHSEDTTQRPWLGLSVYSSSLVPGQKQSLDALISGIEAHGWNVVSCFGPEERLLGMLKDKKGNARVQAVLAFTLKFSSAVNDRVGNALLDLDVPVINALNLYGQTIEEWRRDPKGIQPMHVVWTMANPEISGLIEPTLLTGPVRRSDPDTGREVTEYRTIQDKLDQLLPRLKSWVRLQDMDNRDKRVAILYYNHGQGKQNVGASYLNVFRSLERIVLRMQEEGYQVAEGKLPTEQEIKDLVLKYGRNIGSWAPGELDGMLAEGKVIRLPVSRYKEWFTELPLRFQDRVLEQWGPVEESSIMIKDGELIIPGFRLGNVLLLPEPARGWGDEPMKLYHDPTLQPHHQYIAAYLWLKHEFEADAMIHLGTHATYEWLPGKQAGLSHACPPEVMITDIPNLYPYIVDDVGEGIQAKRRGRGVIIDHLTPPQRPGGLYEEYSRLADLINSFTRSQAVDSQTAGQKLERIAELSRELGLFKELGLQKVNAESLEEIEHYLLELKENLLPYGVHTFGRSPQGQALDDTVQAISEANQEADTEKIKTALAESGKREISRLIQGLEGRFIQAGEGNDPLRNPEALPIGKNFYGFDPQKIPSPAAWELGKNAAQEIVKSSLDKDGNYPDKAAVVLWATETIRNEGVNESTILYLLGLQSVWDDAGRVTGTKVIPGAELQRPRIDVLINPSGLYRDLLPNKLEYLDRAVQKAALQTDIQNLVREHNARLKFRLMDQGVAEEKAAKQSRVRIFTERPGSYGTGVSEMTGASGVWESDQEIAQAYANRVGYAFGQDMWGEPAKELFQYNLSTVDTAVHSRSSNVYGTMDNDDMFQYLGGLALAVRRESGQDPQTLITQQQLPGEVEVEDAAKTIGRELRTRYVNPKWIQGMQEEDYAGAREMAKFVEYMWGWQVTAPQTVDEARWEQTYEVYVQDKYGQEMKKFFNQSNPWAYQSITGRMLEAVRKGYWQAGEEVKKKLASEYAANVVDKGMACCDHTCNNPLLNQMVVNIISLPGVMSAEMVEEFKMALERATGMELAEQTAQRQALQDRLTESLQNKPEKTDKADSRAENAQKDTDQGGSKQGEQPEEVSGYKMEKEDSQDEASELSSSGVQWFATLALLGVVGLFGIGAWRRK